MLPQQKITQRSIILAELFVCSCFLAAALPVSSVSQSCVIILYEDLFTNGARPSQ